MFFRPNFDDFSSHPLAQCFDYSRKAIAATATKVFRELRSSWAVHFRPATLTFIAGCL